MIRLKVQDKKYLPYYATELSAGADVRSRVDTIVNGGTIVAIPLGIWIDLEYNRPQFAHSIVELQLRSRSSLAKQGIVMPNGIGTIDRDYPDEIGMMLWNTTRKPFAIREGDRIGQLIVNQVHRIPDLSIGGSRVGGFGHSGRR